MCAYFVFYFCIDICIGFLLFLNVHVEFFLVCVVSFHVLLSFGEKKTKTHFYLLSPPTFPVSPPSPGWKGGFLVPCCPSSLSLHRYTSLLLSACMGVHTHGPGGAGLRGGLPLSPESLWRLRHIRHIWWDPPAANLGGWGRGGHGGGHGTATAAAIEALGCFQPGEHGQCVREVGGRRWCVSWGAHLDVKR